MRQQPHQKQPLRLPRQLRPHPRMEERASVEGLQAHCHHCRLCRGAVLKRQSPGQQRQLAAHDLHVEDPDHDRGVRDQRCRLPLRAAPQVPPPTPTIEPFFNPKHLKPFSSLNNTQLQGTTYRPATTTTGTQPPRPTATETRAMASLRLSRRCGCARPLTHYASIITCHTSRVTHFAESCG